MSPESICLYEIALLQYSSGTTNKFRSLLHFFFATTIQGAIMAYTHGLKLYGQYFAVLPTACSYIEKASSAKVMRTFIQSLNLDKKPEEYLAFPANRYVQISESDEFANLFLHCQKQMNVYELARCECPYHQFSAKICLWDVFYSDRIIYSFLICRMALAKLTEALVEVGSTVRKREAQETVLAIQVPAPTLSCPAFHA